MDYRRRAIWPVFGLAQGVITIRPRTSPRLSRAGTVAISDNGTNSVSTRVSRPVSAREMTSRSSLILPHSGLSNRTSRGWSQGRACGPHRRRASLRHLARVRVAEGKGKALVRAHKVKQGGDRASRMAGSGFGRTIEAAKFSTQTPVRPARRTPRETCLPTGERAASHPQPRRRRRSGSAGGTRPGSPFDRFGQAVK